MDTSTRTGKYALTVSVGDTVTIHDDSFDDHWTVIELLPHGTYCDDAWKPLAVQPAEFDPNLHRLIGPWLIAETEDRRVLVPALTTYCKATA